MSGEAEVTAALKVSETSLKALLELLKLLKASVEKSKRRGAAGEADGELGAGKVSQSDLMKDAHKRNYTVSAQDGITKSDMQAIAKKAKEYGIPVSFTGKQDADNIKVSFRDSDKAVFSQIMTDIVKEKLAERPNELMSFKLENANATHFRELLKQNDLSADFIIDNKGGVHCIHEVSDKKAFELVKKEFQRKYTEVDENLKVEKSGEYITAEYKNDLSISFKISEPSDYATIREQVQSNFDLDDIETGLAVAKIADSLPPLYQKQLLDRNPLKQVESFESNIRLKDENVLVTPYDFYRIQTKDGLDSFMVQDETGRTATLIPEIMTERQMEEMIAARLGITDKATVAALIAKAETLNTVYREMAKDKAEDYSHGSIVIGLIFFGMGWIRDDAESKTRGLQIVVGGAIVAAVSATVATFM